MLREKEFCSALQDFNVAVIISSFTRFLPQCRVPVRDIKGSYRQ